MPSEVSSKDLDVSLQPFNIRVAHRLTNEVPFLLISHQACAMLAQLLVYMPGGPSFQPQCFSRSFLETQRGPKC